MISLYHFFEKHKVLLYGLLIVSSVLFIYLGSKVEYEEDISKLLPSTQSGSSEELVFANLKVKDKIFLLFLPKSDTVDAGELAEKCDAFVEALLQKDSATQYINNVLYRIDDDLLRSGMEFLFDHAPAFIDTTMYDRMEALMTKEAIERQMAANYDLIISPSGMAFRDMIRQDPIGLRTLFMDNSSLTDNFGGNYKMVFRHFFTPDTTVALAFLSPNFKAFDSKESIHLANMLEAEIATFYEENPDIEILFHGAPIQSVFNSRQIKKDLVLTMGISLLIICFIIGFCFRNRSTLLMLLSPVAYGAFFALAGVYVIKGGMSLLAIGIGAIVLGVALSYSLHLLTHSKYMNDPVRIIREQTRPITLCCLTTVGAFMGLMFTQSALLHDFGLFASLALIGTAFFCLFFLPHFFRPDNNRRSDKAFEWLNKINTFPFDRQKWLIALITIVCGVCFYTSRWMTFDSDLKNIGYNDPDVIRSNQILAEKTTHGNLSIYYAATSHNLDSAIYYSGQMADFLDTLQANGRISDYSRAASLLLIPEAEQALRIRHWRNYWTPERIAGIREKLTAAGQVYRFKPETFAPFYEMLENDSEAVSLFEADIIPDELLSNITEYTDSTYMVFTSVQMPPDNKKSVNTAIATRPHWIVIDPFYYTSDMVELINDDFNMVLSISSVFIFIVLLVSFRKLSQAIIAFIPMGLSWYIVLGVMGIFGMQFNLINIVISSFIFGIGVDYSIFVMDGLLAGTFGTNSNLLTYHKTAIFFSAIVLIIGIASLMFAAHPAIKSIGFATLIGMSSTVLIAYTVQPFLFHLLIKRFKGSKIL